MIRGIPPEFLQQIILQAEREYPSECCGLILGPTQNRTQYSRLWPCRNVQDDLHASDPVRFPRNSQTAYFIDSTDLLNAQREARSCGDAIRVIYHSHIEAPPLFSEEDAKMAAPDGEPLYPGADYLILSVRAGKTQEMSLYRWDGKQYRYKLLEA